MVFQRAIEVERRGPEQHSSVVSLVVIASEQVGDDSWLDPTKERDVTVFDSDGAPRDCRVDKLLASVQLADGAFEVRVLSTLLREMLNI